MLALFYSLECVIPSVDKTQKADLDVVINGISWERPSFINYYNPVLSTIAAGGNVESKYGPVAGGTDILVCHIQYTVLLLSLFLYLPNIN